MSKRDFLLRKLFSKIIVGIKIGYKISCKQAQRVHYHRDSIFTCVDWIHINKHHHKTDSEHDYSNETLKSTKCLRKKLLLYAMVSDALWREEN